MYFAHILLSLVFCFNGLSFLNGAKLQIESRSVSTQYWVTDGLCGQCGPHHCTSGSPESAGSFQQTSHLAGVRCCSQDGNSCVTPGNCPDDNMSFDDATRKCAELGKRLCTKDELNGEVCCGTGGMCNLYEVWSSEAVPTTTTTTTTTTEAP